MNAEGSKSDPRESRVKEREFHARHKNASNASGEQRNGDVLDAFVDRHTGPSVPTRITFTRHVFLSALTRILYRSPPVKTRIYLSQSALS